MSDNRIRLAVFGGYLVGWMTALAWHFGAPVIVYVPFATLGLTALASWAIGQRKATR